MSRPIAAVAVVVALLATATGASAQAPGAGSAGFSTSAEYLLWWTKNSPAPPPLLSTAPLGSSGFSTVLGGNSYDTGPQQGGRFSASYRFSPDWAIEGIGFFLPDTTVTKTVSSSGAPGSLSLGVPQFYVDDGSEGFLSIARPGDFFGTAREQLTINMSGAELNLAWRATAGGGWRMDLLGGFRYFRLKEQLTFSASSVGLAVTDIFDPTDRFATDNQFYGGQFGVKGEYTAGGFFAEGTIKVGLGVMRESVDISGSLFTNDFNNLGVPQTYPGGFFAQPTNIGNHGRDRFAVVPEVGLKIGYKLTSWASVFAGYTFMYVSAVVRPGSQIDRSLNPSQSLTYQIPQSPPPSTTLQGAARPAFTFRESDFWVQGVSAGFAFNF